MRFLVLELYDSPSMRRALVKIAQHACEERDYFDNDGGHGATAEAFEEIAQEIGDALGDES